MQSMSAREAELAWVCLRQGIGKGSVSIRGKKGEIIQEVGHPCPALTSFERVFHHEAFSWSLITHPSCHGSLSSTSMTESGEGGLYYPKSDHWSKKGKEEGIIAERMDGT